MCVAGVRKNKRIKSEKSNRSMVLLSVLTLLLLLIKQTKKKTIRSFKADSQRQSKDPVPRAQCYVVQGLVVGQTKRQKEEPEEHRQRDSMSPQSLVLHMLAVLLGVVGPGEA